MSHNAVWGVWGAGMAGWGRRLVWWTPGRANSGWAHPGTHGLEGAQDLGGSGSLGGWGDIGGKGARGGKGDYRHSGLKRI